MGEWSGWSWRTWEAEAAQDTRPAWSDRQWQDHAGGQNDAWGGDGGARASEPAVMSSRPKAKAKQAPKAKAKPKAKADNRNARDRRDFERWNSDHRRMMVAEHEAERSAAALQELQFELWSLEITTDLLQTDMENLQTELKQEQEKLREEQGRNSRLLNDVDKAMRQKLDLEQKICEVRSQKDELSGKLKQCEKRLESAQLDTAALKRQGNAAEFDLKRKTEENTAIRADHSKYKAKTDKVIEELTAEKAKKDKVIQDLTAEK
ncbi:Nlrc3, partial [Symbiodinium sp. CCMP2592]